VIDFDDKPYETTDLPQLLTVNSRTECIVRLPTKTSGTGIISKRKLVAGVYLAGTLTEGIGGYCITGMVNTSEEDVTIETPDVE
jgi:hypothetical protein